MNDENTASILRSIQDTLRRMEARQIQMDERQRLIKTEVEAGAEAQPELGSFGRSEIPHERTGH